MWEYFLYNDSFYSTLFVQNMQTDLKKIAIILKIDRIGNEERENAQKEFNKEETDYTFCGSSDSIFIDGNLSDLCPA